MLVKSLLQQFLKLGLMLNNVTFTNNSIRSLDFLCFDLAKKFLHSRDVGGHRQKHENVLLDILNAPVLTTIELFDQLDHDLSFLPREKQPLSNIVYVCERFLLLQFFSHINQVILVSVPVIGLIGTDTFGEP